MKRYRFLSILFILCLFQNFLIRTILTIKEFSFLNHSITNSLMNLFKIYGWGAYNDTLFFSYFAIPLVLYFTFMPSRVLASKIHQRTLLILSFLIIALFSFIGHAEWFFWDEFQSRFNFIAVDYLMYTTEVINNIKQSYPMYKVYGSILLSSLIIFILFLKFIRASLIEFPKKSFGMGLILLTAPLFTFFVFGHHWRTLSDNRVIDQLAKNGPYEFFSAFRHNDINYNTFYKTLPEEDVAQYMQRELSNRLITHRGPEKRYNVILVAVESLSALYVGAFSNSNLTPYLDAIAKKSLIFTNFFATGTRTVRGLEALALSLPPTPGHSIIRRTHNEHLFSLGSLFKERGYDVKFVYGGYGYFDNMNYFFKNNDFDIVDKTDFKHEEIDFSNVWGVCDENLFSKTIQEADTSYAQGHPFMSLVMTTTNHRPFSYPDGRIDIPSKTGREGAVKYTDYAIGKLIKDASQKPWFDNTIFIIVADHCSGGRGNTTINVFDYHIPLIIYAPKLIKPAVIDRLSSQIDVAPTLAGLLHFTYKTKFFGKDILKMDKNEGRAFSATYQNVGYFKNGELVVLSPGKTAEYFTYNPKTLETKKSTTQNPELLPKLLKEAIGYYQYSSFLLTHKLLGK